MGGFAALRSALIDDCTLAKKFRQQGSKTWIGLTHSAISLRPYDQLKDTWNMVARTAYTQLGYSPLLLLLCTILMGVAYLVPILSILKRPLVSLITLLLMAATYRPIVLYYNLSPFWILGLPVAGFLYLIMTWTSAIRYYSGERSQWKGRSYS